MSQEHLPEYQLIDLSQARQEVRDRVRMSEEEAARRNGAYRKAGQSLRWVAVSAATQQKGGAR